MTASLPAIAPVIRFAILILALALPAVPARAEERPVHAPDGIALGGHDAVAYFTRGAAVPGRPDHALRWRGAIWLFSGPDTLMAFEMNPRAYAPRFGGYCTLALSQGRLAPGNPTVFAIRDGRLYLLGRPEDAARFAAEGAERIRAAEAQWPAILKR